MKKNQKGFVPIIVLLIVVLLAGGIYWGIKSGKLPLKVSTNSPVTRTMPSLQPNPTTSKDEKLFIATVNIPQDTSSWRVYENKQYGVTFRYPSEMPEDDPISPSSLAQLSNGKEKVFADFSLYATPAYNLFFNVYQLDSNNIQDWLKIHTFNPTLNGKAFDNPENYYLNTQNLSTFQFKGNQAIKFTTYAYESGVRNDVVAIVHENYVYVLSNQKYTKPDTKDFEDEDAFFNTALNTITFTN